MWESRCPSREELNVLRFPADAIYYQLDGIHGIGARDALPWRLWGVPDDIIFAYRSGDLWGPGKILALVFATMCLLNWALDLLAALVMNYRMQVPCTRRPIIVDTSLVSGIATSPLHWVRFRIAHPRLRDLQNQVGESVLALVWTGFWCSRSVDRRVTCILRLLGTCH